MEELNVVQEIGRIVDGNTIVLLYIAVSITRYILIPIYHGSNRIGKIIDAMTEALIASRDGHNAIAIEIARLYDAIQDSTSRESV